MASFAQYSLIIHQLEESKRFILSGSLPYLRIALILLDNAIEMFLTMAIEPELRHDEMRKMIRETALRLPASAESTGLADAIGYQPLTRDRKRRISKYFDEKVIFLSKDCSVIDPHVGEVTSHLHTYRNSAYHQGSIREETILPAVMLQFEIATNLLVEFGPTSCSSADQEDWLKDRYGLKAMDLFERTNREAIAATLRDGMSMTEIDLKERLTNHVESRVNELYEALDFIHETTSIFSSREEALKSVQYWRKYPDDPILNDKTNFDRFEPTTDLHDIDAWVEKARTIADAKSRIDAFRIFSEIERDLEPLEVMVFEMAAEIDRAIQLQIDIRRGK